MMMIDAINAIRKEPFKPRLECKFRHRKYIDAKTSNKYMQAKVIVAVNSGFDTVKKTQVETKISIPLLSCYFTLLIKIGHLFRCKIKGARYYTYTVTEKGLAFIADKLNQEN